MNATCSAARRRRRRGVPGWDTMAGFLPRRCRWSRRRAAGAGADGVARVSVKTAIALRSPGMRLGLPPNHPHGFSEGESPPFFIGPSACGRAASRRNSRLSSRPRTVVKREPLFNIPPVILALLAVLALVHAVRSYVLTDQQAVE